MDAVIIIGLVILGIILIGVEIFFIPGTTIIGIIGFITCIIGVYYAYQDLGNVYGHGALALTVLGPGIMFYLGIKFKVWNLFALNDTVNGRANNNDKFIPQIGAEGKALSALRPSGSAEFEDQIIEVRSEGDYIDAQSRVVITRLDGDRIYVEPLINKSE